jgi:membrane protein
MHIIKTGHKNNSSLKSFFLHIFQDHLFENAATLSYYFLFSVFPMAIFVSAAFSNLNISTESLSYLSRIIPEQILSLFQSYLKETTLGNTPTLIFVGSLLTIYSVGKVIQTMKRKFRLSYKVDPQISFVKEWCVSLVFVVLFLVSFYATLILIVIGNNIIHWLSLILPGIGNILPFVHFIRYATVAAYLGFVLFGLYYILPGVKQKILFIFPGTIFALLGWIVMSWLFSFYFNRINDYTSLYGSLSTIIALLTWLFLLNTILLLGARINSYIYLLDSGKNHD